MKQCVKLVELSQVSILLRGLCGKRNDEHAGLDWIGLTVGYWYLHYSKDCSRAQNPSLLGLTRCRLGWLFEKEESVESMAELLEVGDKKSCFWST